VVALFELPDYVSCPVDFTDTGFKDQVIVNSGDEFGLEDGIEPDTLVGEMTDYRQIILSLPTFFQSGLHRWLFKDLREPRFNGCRLQSISP
jgi:hypothetical protein